MKAESKHATWSSLFGLLSSVFDLRNKWLLYVLVTLLCSFTTTPAMTPVGESEPEGYPFPFRVRGDLAADFGLESPSLSFRQNTALRLFTEKELGKNISAELQIYITYSNTDNQFSTSLRDSSFLSRSTSNFLDFFTNNKNDSTLPEWRDIFNFGETVLNSRLIPKLSLLFDRANIKYRGRFADITLGKQVVAWGSGYAWNPTDAINLRNPLSPTEPRKGVGALVVDIPFHEWFLLTMAMAPGKIIQESTEGLRLKFMNRWFDVAFSGNIVGSSERYLLNNSLKTAVDESINVVKPMVGFDINTVLPWDINVWLETSVGAVSLQDSLSISQTVFGFQRVFFDKLRLLMEFYANSLGVSTPYSNKKAVSRNLALVTLGDMSGISRSYYALGLQYPFNERWEASTVFIKNTSDGSWGLAPLLTWQPRQDFKFTTEAHLFGGNYKTTEFGSFKHSLVMNFKYLF